MPFDPSTEIQGIRRPKSRPIIDRARWGTPPTYEEWLQIHQVAAGGQPDDEGN